MPITIEDISKELGVSISTVSRALNGKDDVSEATRKRVQDIAKELGYRPSAAARSLRRQRTNKIGVVFNSGISYISDYFAEIIIGATTAAEENDHHIVLYTNEGDFPDRLLNLFKSREVDGLILVLSHVPAATIEEMLAENLPFIILGRRANHPRASYITPDNYQGALSLMTHLIEQGHRRIAFTAYPIMKLTHEDRFAAYRDALAKANIPYDASLVVEAKIDHHYNKQVVNKLLDLPKRPTAVFAFHDLIAIDVLQAILERGLRVPQDIALAGFDGLNASLRTTPTITTVQQPLREIGTLAVNALLTQIENNQHPPIQTTLPVKLVERGSTLYL